MRHILPQSLLLWFVVPKDTYDPTPQSMPPSLNVDEKPRGIRGRLSDVARRIKAWLRDVE